MDRNFRSGEITSFEMGKKNKNKGDDQLEREFTAGEIMPKERYLGKDESKRAEKTKKTR